MRYVVLAAGFDGTLARDGRCDERSIAALRALAASGRKLILVTSRELRDLLDVFPQAKLFDYLVAENGAVIHKPAARESAILAHAPSELLIHELRRRRIEPLSVGSVVVTTARAHREVVVEIVERLKLDCYLLDNGASIAVLPTGVDKATGVHHVLEELGLSHHNLVAIGDAENDAAMLEFAEHSVAVANAVPMLKRLADRVTRAPYSDAVTELVREVIHSDLAGAPTRQSIVLGTRAGQHRVAFSPAQCSLLVSGPIASGKAALCRSILGQYLAKQYQCCVIGVAPAAGLINREQVVSLGDDLTPPDLADVLTSLEVPKRSVVVNVAALRPSARATLAAELMERLEILANERGRPHLIMFDQADALLDANTVSACLRMKEVAQIFATAQPDRLPIGVRSSVDIVVALGEPAMTLAHVREDALKLAMQMDTSSSESGQAVVWIRESGTGPFRIDLALNASIARASSSEEEAIEAAKRTGSSRQPSSEAAIP